MSRARLGVSIALASLVLVATATASATGPELGHAVPAWPKVSHLTDGAMVTVSAKGRVIERDRLGHLISDSTFESYPVYERWVTFIRAFQAELKSDERSRIANSIAYPLVWSQGKIGNRQELLAHYSAILQPRTVAAILAADPRALFCQNVSQVMLGSGVIWGDDFGRRLAIITVNPPVP